MKINKNSKFKTNLQLFAGEITDLTGTTWVLKNVIDIFNTFTYSLNFSSNSANYNRFVVEPGNDGNNLIYYYIVPMLPQRSVNVYDNDTDIWTSEDYKTISITGGTDATNSTLIAWLEANATQIQTGYSSTITLTNCTCNKSAETGLSGSYSATITADDGYYLSSVTSTLGTATISTNKKTASIEISDITADFTITATGTAKTIKNVILHPNNNGETDYTTDIMPQVNSASELEINRLFRTRYTITPTITNGSSSGDEYIWSQETAQITIIPEENYSLPSSITVSGASYTYDSSSGVVNLSNATGNVTITCVCETVVSEYSVQVTFQNGSDIWAWTSTKLYDNYTEEYGTMFLNSTDEIDSISSANGSTTVSISTGKLAIFSENPNFEDFGQTTTSSGITLENTMTGVILNNSDDKNGPVWIFNIENSGTITIDGADWDN